MADATYQVLIERTDGWHEKFFDQESAARKYYAGCDVFLSRELRQLDETAQTDQYGGTIHRVTVLDSERGVGSMR